MIITHGKVTAIAGAREVRGELGCMHGTARGHDCVKCEREDRPASTMTPRDIVCVLDFGGLFTKALGEALRKLHEPMYFRRQGTAPFSSTVRAFGIVQRYYDETPAAVRDDR